MPQWSRLGESRNSGGLKLSGPGGRGLNGAGSVRAETVESVPEPPRLLRGLNGAGSVRAGTAPHPTPRGGRAGSLNGAGSVRAGTGGGDPATAPDGGIA